MEKNYISLFDKIIVNIFVNLYFIDTDELLIEII